MNAAFVHEERPDKRIPAELMSCLQWIAWWSVPGTGRPVQLPNGRSSPVLKEQARPHKLPINPRTGGLAATTQPGTWSSARDCGEGLSAMVIDRDRLRLYGF